MINSEISTGGIEEPPVITSCQIAVALRRPLDASAYATRLSRHPRFSAAAWRPAGEGSLSEAAVVLTDECGSPLAAHGLGRDAEVVRIVEPGDTRCGCCHAVSASADWTQLIEVLHAACGDEQPGELAGLTPRELDVLRLVGLGQSVPQTAEQLGVSTSTIGNHKYRLMRKLGVSTSLELLRIAVRNGLVDL